MVGDLRKSEFSYRSCSRFSKLGACLKAKSMPDMCPFTIVQKKQNGETYFLDDPDIIN